MASEVKIKLYNPDNYDEHLAVMRCKEECYGVYTVGKWLHKEQKFRWSFMIIEEVEKNGYFPI